MIGDILLDKKVLDAIVHFSSTVGEGEGKAKIFGNEVLESGSGFSDRKGGKFDESFFGKHADVFFGKRGEGGKSLSTVAGGPTQGNGVFVL